MKPNYDHLFEMADPLAKWLWRLDIRDDQRWKTNVEEAWKEVMPPTPPGKLPSLPPKEPPPRVVEFSQWIRRVWRGKEQPNPPLRLWPGMGRQPADIMWSTSSEVIVISQRVVDVLQAHGFTGWSTYAVEVLDKQGELMPGYYGFAITGRAGKQDLQRGEVIDKPPIVPKGTPYQVLKGFYFEEDFWDGSDFCFAGYGGFIIVTRQVVQALKKAKIHNVSFTPLVEMETNVSTFRIMGLWPPEGR